MTKVHDEPLAVRFRPETPPAQGPINGFHHLRDFLFLPKLSCNLHTDGQSSYSLSVVQAPFAIETRLNLT